MPSTAKQTETTAYENMQATPFTRVHGCPSCSDYEILKSEASSLESEVKDITYDWSHDNTNDYGLLADILSLNEYYTLTSIDAYVAPVEPATYDPTITNSTLTHECKRKEEGWDCICQSWFIRKGFLKGIVDNLRDALDEQYYSQLKNCLTAYRNSKCLDGEQRALIRSNVTILDEDKLQFYLKEMYDSNNFDKNDMLDWEKQLRTCKSLLRRSHQSHGHISTKRRREHIQLQQIRVRMQSRQLWGRDLRIHCKNSNCSTK
jgi:hypothetical protein